MNKESKELLIKINQAIIKFRNIYSKWSKFHNISYNEMLVLYSIRDDGYCTQKQIVNNYLLPKQTINNVFNSMINRNILCLDNKKSYRKEKAYVLTKEGEEYANNLIKSINIIEENAIKTMGKDKINTMITLINEYDFILKNELVKEECYE